MPKFDKVKYDNEFAKINYDRIPYQVPKGGKEKLKALATQNKTSVNALITNALEKQYNIDLSKKDL